MAHTNALKLLGSPHHELFNGIIWTDAGVNDIEGVAFKAEEMIGVIYDMLSDLGYDDDQACSTMLGWMRNWVLHSELHAPREDLDNDGQPDEMQEWHDFDPEC